MSKSGFLKRWSRRKQGESEPAEGPEPAPPAPVPAPERAPGAPEALPAAAPPSETEEPFDPATLPPIESLGADSDYTMFLKKGVPEALRLAALRKAWVSDTFIRDFRSPAIEYGWDFTTPEFALRPTDDVAKLLDGIFGVKPQTAAAPESSPAAGDSVPEGPLEAAELAPAPALAPPVADLPQSGAVPEPSTVPAEPAAVPPMARRKHGGALPD